MDSAISYVQHRPNKIPAKKIYRIWKKVNKKNKIKQN